MHNYLTVPARKFGLRLQAVCGERGVGEQGGGQGGQFAVGMMMNVSRHVRDIKAFPHVFRVRSVMLLWGDRYRGRAGAGPWVSRIWEWQRKGGSRRMILCVFCFEGRGEGGSRQRRCTPWVLRSRQKMSFPVVGGVFFWCLLCCP